MAPLVAADVQLGPLAVPVEGDAIRSLVLFVEALEVFVLDISESLNIEEPEGDLIFGVRFVQNILEIGPVWQCDLAPALSVGDLEEEVVLVALDFVLNTSSNCQSVESSLGRRDAA